MTKLCIFMNFATVGMAKFLTMYILIDYLILQRNCEKYPLKIIFININTMKKIKNMNNRVEPFPKFYYFWENLY